MSIREVDIVSVFCRLEVQIQGLLLEALNKDYCRREIKVYAQGIILLEWIKER